MEEDEDCKKFLDDFFSGIKTGIKRDDDKISEAHSLEKKLKFKPIFPETLEGTALFLLNYRERPCVVTINIHPSLYGPDAGGKQPLFLVNNETTFNDLINRPDSDSHTARMSALRTKFKQ